MSEPKKERGRPPKEINPDSRDMGNLHLVRKPTSIRIPAIPDLSTFLPDETPVEAIRHFIDTHPEY